MRVLTVRQPWAWAILHGRKNVENRVLNIAGDYRGQVAIHAGLAWDADDDGLVKMYPAQVADAIEQQGHIIGVVDLVDVHPADGLGGCASEVDLNGAGATRLDFCSMWAMPGHFHLALENPRALREPIPFRGALGLRVLPAEVEASVLAGVVS